MKAVSLWQPWASAIACGYKHFETRSWQPPVYLIGQVIAIHAAKRWTKEEQEYFEDFMEDGIPICQEGTPPLGCVVAVARLASYFTSESALRIIEKHGDDPLWKHEKDLGNFEPGRFAWAMRDVIALPSPIPCKGAQGFFNLPTDVEQALVRQALEDFK